MRADALPAHSGRRSPVCRKRERERTGILLLALDSLLQASRKLMLNSAPTQPGPNIGGVAAKQGCMASPMPFDPPNDTPEDGPSDDSDQMDFRRNAHENYDLYELQGCGNPPFDPLEDLIRAPFEDLICQFDPEAHNPDVVYQYPPKVTGKLRALFRDAAKAAMAAEA